MRFPSREKIIANAINVASIFTSQTSFRVWKSLMKNVFEA